MENKQTAVEWLIDKVEDHFCLLPVDLIEQAKEIEKEQIKDAFINYFYNDDLPLNDKRALHKIAEQYYNETYGK